MIEWMNKYYLPKMITIQRPMQMYKQIERLLWYIYILLFSFKIVMLFVCVTTRTIITVFRKSIFQRLSRLVCTDYAYRILRSFIFRNVSYFPSNCECIKMLILILLLLLRIKYVDCYFTGLKLCND